MVSVIGFDVADNAVRYAISVGLLDRGVVANLEVDRPDEDAMRAFATADLIAVTGGVGYVGQKTFRAIVEASGDDPPWVAALSLRWVDFSPIAETLDGLGLVTEQVEGYCVPQRRFANESERQAALTGLRAQGLDSVPELLLGAHCAELYVSRPPEAVRATPISDVLGFLTAEPRRRILWRARGHHWLWEAEVVWWLLPAVYAGSRVGLYRSKVVLGLTQHHVLRARPLLRCCDLGFCAGLQTKGDSC